MEIERNITKTIILTPSELTPDIETILENKLSETINTCDEEGVLISIENIKNTTNNPLATLAVTDRNSSRYLLFNTLNRLAGWRNVSTGEEKGPVIEYTHSEKILLQQKAFSGIHIIKSSIFNKMEQRGKFSLIDVYMSLCGKNNIESFDHSSSLLLDVGKPESIIKAETLFK